MRRPVRGGRPAPLDHLQFKGQPAGGAERPPAGQARVGLLHQDLGAGLCGAGGHALLLPAQHHQGALRPLPEGHGSGDTGLTRLGRAQLSLDGLRHSLFSRSVV